MIGLTQGAAHQIAAFLDHAGDVDRLRIERLAAGEGEQLAGQPFALLQRHHRRLQEAGGRLLGPDIAEGEIEIGDDHLQQIIEIVGDAARQIADRLHLAGLAVDRLRLGHLAAALAQAPAAEGEAGQRQQPGGGQGDAQPLEAQLHLVGALGIQLAFAPLELGHQGADGVHHALVDRRRPAGLVELGDLLGVQVEFASDQHIEAGQGLLLLRIVGGQVEQLLQGRRRLVLGAGPGLQMDRVAGQQIAARAGLGVDQFGQQRTLPANDLERMVDPGLAVLGIIDGGDAQHRHRR